MDLTPFFAMQSPYWTYLIPIILLTLTPGVDTVLIIRNSTRGGWRDGAISSLGICCGLFVHAIVSAVGISVILLQSAWAFSLLKLAGAGYLIWLGAVSLRHACVAKKATTHFDSIQGFQPLCIQRSFLEGFLSNVLNPKAIVFYMAFLPQFIDPGRSALRQSMFLAGIHFSVAMVWQCLLASAVDRTRRIITKPFIRRSLDGLTGTVMLFFGASLLFLKE